MYTSFTIKNFRCFEQLTIEPLARINLIAGKNNTGKTALLEALWLHSGPNVPDLGIRLASFRGIPGQDPRRLLHDLFYNSDPSRTITLSAKHRGINNPRKLDISSRPFGAGEVPIPFPNPPSAVPRGSQEPDVSAASSSKIVLDYTDEFGGNYVSTGWWATSQLPPIIAPLPGMAIESAWELRVDRLVGNQPIASNYCSITRHGYRKCGNGAQPGGYATRPPFDLFEPSIAQQPAGRAGEVW